MDKPIIDVTLEHGFAHNWHLILPATKTLPMQMFWLGQDVKFVNRVMGMTPAYFNALVREELGVGDVELCYYHRSVRQAAARVIVRHFGGMRRLRVLNPWDLASQ